MNFVRYVHTRPSRARYAEYVATPDGKYIIGLWDERDPGVRVVPEYMIENEWLGAEPYSKGFGLKPNWELADEAMDRWVSGEDF